MNTPSYIVSSPVGIHVMDLQDFMRSPHKAPASSDPVRMGWATEDSTSELKQIFPPTPIGIAIYTLFLYNKTRDTDRICPACRRWYHVGEAPGYDAETGVTSSFASFEEFTQRHAPETPPDLENDEVAREQDLSGICSRVCMAAMNSGDDSQFGLNIDQVTPEQISRHSANVERATGCSVRMTTPEEEARMGGVKILYFKRS